MPSRLRFRREFSGRRRALYALRDSFTQVVTVGSLNNTQSIPGPGYRTVVDTASKLVVNGSYALCDQFITARVAGTVDSTTAEPGFGYRTVVDGELIANGGFEVAGAGGADVFGSWTEAASDGAIADETVLVHGGSHAAKLTTGVTTTAAGARITQDRPVVPGLTYTLLLWTRGDGTNAGRYQLYDVSNGAYLNGSTSGISTGVSGTAYSQITTTVVIPAGCTSLRVVLLAGGVNGAVAYFDDVSVQSPDRKLSIS